MMASGVAMTACYGGPPTAPLRLAPQPMSQCEASALSATVDATDQAVTLRIREAIGSNQFLPDEPIQVEGGTLAEHHFNDGELLVRLWPDAPSTTIRVRIPRSSCTPRTGARVVLIAEATRLDPDRFEYQVTVRYVEE